MNKQGEKSIPLQASTRNRNLLVVTLAGEYLPPQSFYQGKMERYHPTIDYPSEWNMWHSEKHWYNEAMVRYVEIIIFPFIKKIRSLDSRGSSMCCNIWMSSEISNPCKLFQNYSRGNIRHFNVPANCTDKGQPFDLSVNKPLKDEMKQYFQCWYAEEIQKQQ